jgi:hypothetical protein
MIFTLPKRHFSLNADTAEPGFRQVGGKPDQESKML